MDEVESFDLAKLGPGGDRFDHASSFKLYPSRLRGPGFGLGGCLTPALHFPRLKNLRRRLTNRSSLGFPSPEGSVWPVHRPDTMAGVNAIIDYHLEQAFDCRYERPEYEA